MVEKLEINKVEHVNVNEIGLAVTSWARGDLEKALDLYEKFGIEIFRRLPERFWKIKPGGITLYRALSKDEIEAGPIMFGGKDDKKRIQRLTSWSLDNNFSKSWAGPDGAVLSMNADQSDIAFAPLSNSGHLNEKEVVVADYHLKKEKCSKVI